MSALRVLSHIGLGLLEPVRRAHPEIELIQIPETGPLPDDAHGQVLLTQTWGAPNTADVMARGIEWVHTFGTGVNRFPFETLGQARLTCSRGASAIPISEWVMAMLLSFEKQLPDRWISEAPERWNWATLGGLHGRRLAILGFGGIGQAVARHALGFGMRVRAHRRSAAPSPIEAVEMTTSHQALLEAADHLVIAAPATAETHHLVGDAFLAHARPGLHLVNVARGSLVDQEALRRALDGGRVACASLDTVDPEPLPEAHWLYTHPRVRLSAHISWSGPGALEGLIDPFVENLGRFRAGEPLVHEVDVAAGY